MADVTVYSSAFCPYCIRAKALLKRKGVQYVDISVDGRPDLRAEMSALAGRTSVPQIWINGQHVGGCDDLHALERRGELDGLLAEKTLNF
jgi:glutaredoxin 3